MKRREEILKMKAILSSSTMLGIGLLMMTNSLSTVLAASAVSANMHESDIMIHRVENADAKYQKLFGDKKTALEKNDPNFSNVMKRFTYGEVEQQGNLSDKQRMLITLAVLETTNSQDLFRENIPAALHIGVKPEEIKEMIYQTAPYIGFPNAITALKITNEVFIKNNIKLLLKDQSTVDEKTRFEKGLAVQKQIFGDDHINDLYANSSKEQLHIQHYLSGYCFGDTYTRKVLDLKTREMITMVSIAALGDCIPQLKAHVQANINVGNSKETIISALTQCVPYIGFPRSLNAMKAMNEVFAAQKK